ncbi:MAG: peptide chain release factor N(5)-glutamine methyltransferase [Thioalkalivibrio sp.]|nr:MAG: peptide chain release factor N(5)-glutamine methyltransferase [Thioalkalivibrio sp.]
MPTTDASTVAGLLAESRDRLQRAGIDQAGLEARLLVGHQLETTGAGLIAFGERPVTPRQAEAVRALVAARVAGQPIAYLLGRREFWSLPLQVDAGCLIPRPETELLVERALGHLPAGPARALDLGTGSGAIALALKSERPQLQAWASDVEAGALAVAAANACRLGLTVHWFRGRWLEAVASRPLFDLIVSNPPYVAADDPHLTTGDLRFEPRRALVAADGGLADLRAIAAASHSRLRPGGWLLLEHGAGQGSAVRALLREAGCREVSSHADLAGLERVTEGRAGA